MVPWICKCGSSNTLNFCTKCGTAKDNIPDGIWKCTCGQSNNNNFCITCGRAKPAAPDKKITPSTTESTKDFQSLFASEATTNQKSTDKTNDRFDTDSIGAPSVKPIITPMAKSSDDSDSAPTIEQSDESPQDSSNPTPESKDAIIEPPSPDQESTAQINNHTGKAKTLKVLAGVISFLLVTGFGYYQYSENKYSSNVDNFIQSNYDEANTINMINRLDGNPEEALYNDAIGALKVEADTLKSLKEYFNSQSASNNDEKHIKELQELTAHHEFVIKKAYAILTFKDSIAGPINTENHNQFKNLLEEFTTGCEDGKTIIRNNTNLLIHNTNICETIDYDSLYKAIRQYASEKYNYDAKLIQESQKDYQAKLTAANNALINLHELVFLTSTVTRSGKNELTLDGMFYNGTNETITSIHDMLVDVTLKAGTTEIVTVKDCKYQAAALENISIAPNTKYGPLNLKIVADLPDEKFDNFNVSVHKIHWKVKRLVKKQ